MPCGGTVIASIAIIPLTVDLSSYHPRTAEPESARRLRTTQAKEAPGSWATSGAAMLRFGFLTWCRP